MALSGPKVLHASVLSRVSSGIANQLMLESVAAKELDIDWTTRIFSPPAHDLEMIEEIHEHATMAPVHPLATRYQRFNSYSRLRKEFFNWLQSVQNDYDLILLRYSVHDLALYSFLRHTNAKVGLVHHTLEVPELRTADRVIGNQRAFLESVIGKRSIRMSDLTLGVTREIAAYETNRAGDGRPESYVYPNGSRWDGELAPDTRQAVPHLLFMASENAPWHGLDILLSTMSEVDQEFRFHLVGAMDSLTVDKVRNDHRIQLHGTVGFQELNQIMGQCVAGLSSFGMARNRMRQACPLKVRDYLAAGLPVVGGHEEVFPGDFQFYAMAEPHIGTIIETASRFAEISRLEVATAALPLISKKEILKGLYSRISIMHLNSVSSKTFMQ